MQQLDHHRQAVVQPHGILGHLCILVAGGEVSEGTHGRLCDVFSIPGSQHSTHQGLDTTHLTTNHITVLLNQSTANSLLYWCYYKGLGCQERQRLLNYFQHIIEQ